MTTTLITRANKGLGPETARILVAAGHSVYIGSRDAERGRAVAEELGCRDVQLDLTDETSVSAAASTIEDEAGLDVLVNNAGVAARRAPSTRTRPPGIRHWSRSAQRSSRET